MSAASYFEVTVYRLESEFSHSCIYPLLERPGDELQNRQVSKTAMAPEIQSPTCHGRVNGHISDLVQKYYFTIIPCGLPLGSNILFY